MLHVEDDNVDDEDDCGQGLVVWKRGRNFYPASPLQIMQNEKNRFSIILNCCNDR